MGNIITIGNQEESKISAFGDDSKFNKTNAFAYVIFENTNLEIARRSLFDLKDKYKIPNNVLIHMRQLTNEHQRKKNNIPHLTEGKITELLSDMIDEMNKIPFLIKGSYFSGNLPKNIVDDEGFDETWSDKGVQSMLAKIALIPLDLEKYQYEDLKIVIARDQTITKFLGKNKRQADR